MNRKNLTAAVMAGLAGAAGLAATAQAVNLNPDGLGQVLIYPYYTTNDGNQTLLSVVNTTENAKAVKVRFLEGFNSREVLDFNLYLSRHDVWVAAIVAASASPGPSTGSGTHLIIPDDSCTVPYLYEDNAVDLPDGSSVGVQTFLDRAYTGSFSDGGPTSADRQNEGHFEIIEMGTIVPESDTEADITHRLHEVTDDDGDVISTYWAPGDCDQLVENWTDYVGGPDGIWYAEAISNGDCTDSDGDFDDASDCKAWTDTMRNSGGLFGGAAIINPENGQMFSYDAKAIQGYDKSYYGVHYIPGTIHPSLDDGNQHNAWVFFGVPQNTAVNLWYANTVDALSAVFMHENLMNEYTTDDLAAAATEWVVTFPTKNFYVDEERLDDAGGVYLPDPDDAGCNGWDPGEPYPPRTGPDVEDQIPPPGHPDYWAGWETCTYLFHPDDSEARNPFTSVFQDGGEACELVGLKTWDRDERTFSESRGGSRPPQVSPAPPPTCDPDIEFCENVEVELCYEVNVIRFGDREVFGTPEVDGSSLLISVDLSGGDANLVDTFVDGWGWLDLFLDDDHYDDQGLVGLPATGFAAYGFENEFLGGGDVKAFYGGLFGHKGSVRRQ